MYSEYSKPRHSYLSRKVPFTLETPIANPVPTKDIRHLLLGSGAVRAVCHIGVIEELGRRLGHPLCFALDTVTGSSAGSLIATFVALGTSSEWMRRMSRNIPSNYTFKFRITDGEESAFDVSSLEKFLRRTLKNLGEDPDMTFRWMPQVCELRIVCFNKELRRAEVFSRSTTPDVKVVDAMMASCTIHHLFPPRRLRSADGKEYYYLDGSTYNSMGFNLAPVNDRSCVLSHLTTQNDRVHKPWQDALSDEDRDRCIMVDGTEVFAMLASPTPASQERLIKSGAEAVSHYYGER